MWILSQMNGLRPGWKWMLGMVRPGSKKQVWVHTEGAELGSASSTHQEGNQWYCIKRPQSHSLFQLEYNTKLKACTKWGGEQDTIILQLLRCILLSQNKTLKRRKVPAAIIFSALTYCPGRWPKWAASAGWFVCEGSERNRCSQACCLQEGHWRSIDHHSELVTPVCPAAAYGSLTKAEVSGVNLLLQCANMFICWWPTVIHPEDDRRGETRRRSTLQHQRGPLLHLNSFISLLWPQGGSCASEEPQRKVLHHSCHASCVQNRSNFIFKWSYWTAWWQFCWRLRCRGRFELCTGTSPRKPRPFLR